LYRVHLTEEQRRELTRRGRASGLAPRTRERLEMVRLAAAGWSIPRIAQHLQRSEPTVRTWIKRFLAGGWDALADAPHLGPPSRLSAALLEALRQHVRQSHRTWTAGQLADWLQEQHGLRLSPAHLGRQLKRAKLRVQRTSRNLKHKQNPAEVARKAAELKTLEKGERKVAWTSAI
jgi:transposase